MRGPVTRRAPTRHRGWIRNLAPVIVASIFLWLELPRGRHTTSHSTATCAGVKHAVFINRDARTDRRAQIESTLERARIRATRIDAVEVFTDESVLSSCWDGGSYKCAGQVGCQRSHLKALTYAMLNQWEHVAVFEDRTSVQECCEKIFEELGPINFLVNNAGVMHYTLTRNLHETEWMEAIDVNIKGVLHTTAAVFPNMLANGGHIVNISSNAGRVAFPGLAVYTGTKFFVEGFSESLRKELINTGIKVTTVQPGDCKSEINQCTTDSAALEKYSQSSRARNVWLDPNDVAETVLWVLTQPEHVTIGEVRVEPRDSPA